VGNFSQDSDIFGPVLTGGWTSDLTMNWGKGTRCLSGYDLLMGCAHLNYIGTGIFYAKLTTILHVVLNPLYQYFLNLL
jgi:hypothetical protein